ncbi:cupin domain-containing protein [Agaribacterium haliotis]|uniref:cupin domain-containing protein n=1 Tax=Agaribacterium haliotis TaxID=2013869 RepID=UPI000BB565A5|nr:cupin domain-containing protein [Agaribacterium haliotis]
MDNQAKHISTENIAIEHGHCGLIRKLNMNGPARIIDLKVQDAERHYHKKTTEYYYILEGTGQVYLDGQLSDVQSGDLITIPPGVVHQAICDKNDMLKILVIEVPPAIGDVHRVDN